MGVFLLPNSVRDPIFPAKLRTFSLPKLNKNRPHWLVGEFAHSLKCHTVQSCFQGTLEVVNQVEASHNDKAFGFGEEESQALPYVQTLRQFPKKELFEKVVLVRFDSCILLSEEDDQRARSASTALFTIEYLCEAGAKLVLVSDWDVQNDQKLSTFADFLTSVLRRKVVPARGTSFDGGSTMEGFERADIVLLDNLSEVKEEVANCPKLAEALSSRVDIFVNDSFSQSHRILASNVGVTRFCYACLAGFHFEQSLNQLRTIKTTDRKPYVAIIGGGSFRDKAVALRSLASICDGLVFVGAMTFPIMHALGVSVPSKLVERGAHKEALELVQSAESRNVQLVYPKDFWCQNDCLSMKLEIFPSHGIMDGWTPVDIGPVSLNEINSLVTKCKKILWIGPVKFHKSNDTSTASKLAQILNQLRQSECSVTVVGNKVCEALVKESSLVSNVNMFYNASVVWEFLNGRKLPGITALDRAHPFDIDWNGVFFDPYKPLVVDIGSGNGLFLLGMAKRRKDLNFLGLEINKKLVCRCMDSAQRLGLRNGYFIATNATSAFRSIVSGYPGKLVLVSIQCPNPDFNNPENRWRMLQRSLVEAIIELLAPNGKVFFQSDVEAVSLRMKQEFLKYGNGELVVNEEKNVVTSRGWLHGNPFGVQSDWEQHALDRGAPMYRLMLSKKSDSTQKFLDF